MTKCCCCNKQIDSEDDDINLCIRHPALFFTTCIECVQTCQYCGEDIGFQRNCFVSCESCDLCEHESCRSCGINITCYSCNKTACEGCIERGETDDVCGCLRMILEALRMKSEVERN